MEDKKGATERRMECFLVAADVVGLVADACMIRARILSPGVNAATITCMMNILGAYDLNFYVKSSGAVRTLGVLPAR